MGDHEIENNTGVTMQKKFEDSKGVFTQPTNFVMTDFWFAIWKPQFLQRCVWGY